MLKPTSRHEPSVLPAGIISVFNRLLPRYCLPEVPCRTSLNFEKLVPKFLCRSSSVPKFDCLVAYQNPKKTLSTNCQYIIRMIVYEDLDTAFNPVLFTWSGEDYHVGWDNCGLKWSREDDFDSKD